MKLEKTECHRNKNQCNKQTQTSERCLSMQKCRHLQRQAEVKQNIKLWLMHALGTAVTIHRSIRIDWCIWFITERMCKNRQVPYYDQSMCCKKALMQLADLNGMVQSSICTIKSIVQSLSWFLWFLLLLLCVQPWSGALKCVRLLRRKSYFSKTNSRLEDRNKPLSCIKEPLNRIREMKRNVYVFINF